MKWLEEKERAEVMNAIVDDYYLRWKKHLLRFFHMSRNKKYYEDPTNLIALQVVMTEKIFRLEDLIKKDNKTRRQAQAAGNKPLVENCERYLNLNRKIVRMAKYILDGLAWRVLDYDRHFLRSTVESQRYSASVDLSPKNYDGTLNVAMNMVTKNNSRVLLNDVTNFLRIGDLTEVGKKTIIWELKESGKKKLSIYTLPSTVGKQLRKVVQVQGVRDLRIMPSATQPFKIEDIPIKFKHYLKDVKAVITKSRSEIVASRYVSDYLFISCVDMNRLGEHLKNQKKISLPHAKWTKPDVVMIHTNYDHFFEKGGDFLRNCAPYSIYPLSGKDCMDLISGNLLLTAELNLTKLENIIRTRDWTVQRVNVEATVKKMVDSLNRLYSGDLFANTVDNTLLILRRADCTIHVSFPTIGYIYQDFMKLDTILDLLEFEYQHIKQKRLVENIAPYILGEKDVWR